MKAVYRIAETNIEISSVYEEVHTLCRDYITNELPHLCVEITREDIEYEREKSAAEDIKEGIEVRAFTDSYLETLAVYRKIAGSLIDNDIILFHGSVVAVDGKGYLFTAVSGTGKSTHTRLWREYLGDRAVMVNDDKPLLKIKDNVTVYGTPWDGKHHLSSNISVVLPIVSLSTDLAATWI